VAHSPDLREADDRDGQRLVLRRRVHSAVRVRSRGRRGRATFGLSEINWGIPPGSVVSKALAETVGPRAALQLVMTGRTFGGREAAEMGLVNKSVPLGRLREEVEALARELAAKNPVVLRAAKLGFKHCRAMSWDQAEDYLYAKLEQSQLLDPEHGREHGLTQFLDEKRIRPGLQSYERP
jgi:trans-feruloyl-CoA hydratase/vanillin synthase